MNCFTAISEKDCHISNLQYYFLKMCAYGVLYNLTDYTSTSQQQLDYCITGGVNTDGTNHRDWPLICHIVIVSTFLTALTNKCDRRI